MRQTTGPACIEVQETHRGCAVGSVLGVGKLQGSHGVGHDVLGKQGVGVRNAEAIAVVLDGPVHQTPEHDALHGATVVVGGVEGLVGGGVELGTEGCAARVVVAGADVELLAHLFQDEGLLELGSCCNVGGEPLGGEAGGVVPLHHKAEHQHLLLSPHNAACLGGWGRIVQGRMTHAARGDVVPL